MVNIDGPMAYRSSISDSKPGLKKGKEKGSKFMGIISSSFLHLLVWWVGIMPWPEERILRFSYASRLIKY